MENMTGKAYNQGSNIAIVLDEIVYSALEFQVEQYLVDVQK